MPDLVAIAVPAGEQFVELMVEAWDQGMAIAPVDARLPVERQNELLDLIAPARIIRLGDNHGVERHTRPNGQPVEDGDALVMTTSGTGGVPKVVVHTHDSIKASAMATSAALAVDPATDKWLCCLPVSHIGGLSVILRALVTSTPLRVHNGFDAKAVRAAAQDDRVTLVSLVTRALNQVPASLFRTVLIGGAAPPDDLPGNVIPTYGMTETGSGVVYGTDVIDGCDLAILGPGDTPMEQPETTGRIAVRGPMLFRGYRAPDGTVSKPLLDGGWFDTGDLGYYRTDDTLEVEGRVGDMIVTGGENVWPAPIEQLLSTRADVAEVAVVGRADADWGHRVVAVVVPTDPADVPSLTALKDTVVEKFPPWCAPKELVIRTTPLPRTSLGKLRRKGLLV